MANIVNAGYVFKDDGTAVSGATVTVLQADTSTSVATGTTNSSGYYSVTTTTENANGYDVKVESGASVRYRRGKDRVQMMELDIRNNTANTQGGLLVANNTNNASNKVATFANRSRTGADNDEIYVSFEMMNDADEIHEFARITAEQNDASNGNEDGELRFGVSVAGSIVDVFTINASTAGVSDMTLDVSGDLTLDADGGDVFFKDGGTTFGSATNNSGELIIKSGTTTALTFSGSSVAVAGDLTITGDDLVMGTNTSGHILVADGTNYNPVAVGGDITMAANGTVTIASTAVETGMIAADAITGAKIADDAIDSEHYTDGSIDNAHIADNAVGLDEMAGIARGKIIYGDASGNPAVLTAGNANEILTSDGTDISWQAATTGDITGVTAGNGLSGGGTSGGVTLALDLSELTDTAIANGDYIVFTDTTDSNATVKGDLADVATLFAGTGLTASSSVIGVDASQAITALTGGDLTIYEDANNADVSLKMGTSATESLTIQVLNGGSNKTAEAVHFSTATASGTADHGSMVFDVDGTDIVTIDDGGLNIGTGSLETATIDYTDGDLSMTIADGGKVTFAAGFAVGSDAAGDILYSDGTNYVRLARGSDDEVLTLASGVPSWAAASGGGDTVAANVPSDGAVSGITATFTAGEALERGEVVYFKQADSKMWKAVATAEATSRCVAMAAADISADASGTFLMMGFCTDNSTFPDYSASSGVGKPVYTPEAETSSQNVPEKTPPDSDGDFVQVIGFVHSANTLYFNPSQDIIEHA